MSEKHAEIIIENDIYFMETVLDKIIINDGYEGIEVLDCNLKLVRKINIFKDIVIHYSYVNSKSDEIILFCPENGCFVHINLNNYDVKTIFIKNTLKNVIFSKVYLWYDNDIIILDLYNMTFIRMDLNKGNLEILKEEEIMGLYPSFYRFCNYINIKSVIDIASKNYKAIVQNGNNEFFVYNLDGSFKKINIENTLDIIDFIYNEGNIGIVYGDYVKIIGNNNKKLIKCEEGDVFLKASYLENGNLVVLSCDKLKQLQSKVLIFG
ncbi:MULTISPECIES: hypothetical protein [Clostridium]|uniref:hypothetical protein n=1 Tax=Clostridium TaxID=1485 RepID=UPI00069DEE50|nr:MULTISPECIES: hypothetical protein [Clostridium]KOF57062.1 hypothetical protein AGR56_10935 [Clostridium sp. DMHC 10]MCD2348069.1 hypothetical protein [Clostridium guangxiense]